MRELLLKRIEEIRRAENGFSRMLMKWGSPISHGELKLYADEVNYEELNDNDLLFLFERIVRRHYSQM